jgi:hypothetical protein
MVHHFLVKGELIFPLSLANLSRGGWERVAMAIRLKASDGVPAGDSFALCRKAVEGVRGLARKVGVVGKRVKKVGCCRFGGL